MGIITLSFIILIGICFVFNTPILGYFIIVILWILKYKYTEYYRNTIIKEDTKRRMIEKNIQNKNKNKKQRRIYEAQKIIQQYENSDILPLDKKDTLIKKYTQLERKK